MKALIAAGGYGTRLFPATKSVPKTMLPVAGKPLIQHVVEELMACGIQEIAILCRRTQTTIVEHFQSSVQLKHFLVQSKAPPETLSEACAIDQMVRSEFIFCDRSTCLGDALLLARDFVGNDPFVLAMGDEIAAKDASPIPKLFDLYRQYGCTVGACRGIGQSPYIITATMWEESTRAVAAGRCRERTIGDCIEVPIGVMIGRYICASDLLRELEAMAKSDLVPDFIDAFGHLASLGRLAAMPFAAEWWHCGDATQLLRAVIDHAVSDPRTGRQVKEYLHRLLVDL